MKDYTKIYDEVRAVAESTIEFAYEKGTYKSVDEAIADVVGHFDGYAAEQEEIFKKYEDEDMSAKDWLDYCRGYLEDTVREWYEEEKEEEEEED